MLAKHPISVLLDNLKSGYNIGSILRIAEALMLERVYLCGEMPQITGKRARKTAVGAEKWIRTQRCPSAFEQGLSLKRQGYHLVAVELTEKSQDYSKVSHQVGASATISLVILCRSVTWVGIGEAGLTKVSFQGVALAIDHGQFHYLGPFTQAGGLSI